MKKKSTTQKALALIKGDVTTYDERSDAAKRESVSALVNEGIALLDGGVVKIGVSCRGLIAGANDIAAAGGKFTAAEEIGQYEFRLFTSTIEGWAREHERKLKIKAAQKIHRMMDGKKAETLDDATPILHAVFIVAGQLKEVRRIGDEQAHEPINPLSALVSKAAEVRIWLETMEPKESPMEAYYSACGADKLHQIEHATRPIAARHAIVERLLKERGEA
jgi:hypothetical protein